MVGIIDVCHATRHTGGEVAARLAEHHHTAARHILTTVVAGSFDDGDGPRVSHAEALAHLTIDIELTARGTIEPGVTGYDIVLGGEVGPGGRQDGNAPAGEALGKVVVGLALELEAHAMHQEGAERLACRALELHLYGVIRQACQSVPAGNLSREHRPHGTVGILDGIVEAHLVLPFYRLLGSSYHLLVEDGALHTQRSARLTDIAREAEYAILPVQQT